MFNQRGVGVTGDKKPDRVAVAIDKDKGSQAALKWAVDNLLARGKNAILIHVRQKPSSASAPAAKVPLDSQAKEFFLPFRCFCTRKDIQVTEVILEDSDIPRAICDYVKSNMIDTLVVGAQKCLGRFKSVDIVGTINKVAPEFCTIYVISKGKMASVRAATSSISKDAIRQAPADARAEESIRGAHAFPQAPRSFLEETDSIRSPFTRGKGLNRSYGELSMPESDISFISSGRPSSGSVHSPERDMMIPRLSSSSESDNQLSFGSSYSNSRLSDASNSYSIFSSSSEESAHTSWSGSQSMVSK